MPPLKVLIAGGGVAGTALAFWLSKLKHEVTVVEHFPTLRTTGLQIDLRSHGVEVLNRMGLEKAFRENAAPEEGMQFIDLQGRKRAYLGANKGGKGNQGITSEYEIMRGDLCRIIHDATNGKAKYIFGTSVKSFKDGEKGVEIEFKNGEKENYDLFVGADGVWSSTRRLLLGEEEAAKCFHPLGENNAYLTYKQPMEKDEKYVGQMYLAPDKRAILLRRHNPEEMQLYLLLNRDDERLKQVKRADVENEKKAFEQIYEGAGWRTEELMDKMRAADDFYCERLGVVRMPSWYQGNVALVGDAAYGPGGSGMGTTTAMVGAYVLAGEIGKHCSPSSSTQSKEGLQQALKAYDQTFRPFMTKLHSTLNSSDDTAMSWLMPSGVWGITILHFVIEIFSKLWLDPIAQWFMREGKEGWKLPVYEELRVAKEEEDAGK